MTDPSILTRARAPHDARFTPPRLAERLDAVLKRTIDEQRLVGAAVLVAHAGKLVYQRAMGHADREAARPLSEASLFRLASLTKPLVSVATLALIARGTLTLDDPVSSWLPDFRPSLADGRVPRLTVRHLLTHTSGLGYGFFDAERERYLEAEISNGLDRPGLSFSQNAARLASVPLFEEPGTAFRYSLATDVLGEVIVRASNSNLPELLARLVTAPLDMTETGFHALDPTRLVVPYTDGKPPRRMLAAELLEFPGGATSFAPARVLVGGSYPSGGSGLVGTATDYMKFLEALRVKDARLLDGPSYAQLTRDQISGALRPTPVPGDGWGFGFGLAILDSPTVAQSPLSPGSYRWEGVYGNTFWVDPHEQLSVVALTNTTFEGIFGQFPGEVQRAVYDRALG